MLADVMIMSPNITFGDIFDSSLGNMDCRIIINYATFSKIFL